MRYLSSLFLLVTLLFAVPAFAQTQTLYSLTDCSISSLSGSSQSLVVSNPQRKYLMIFNPASHNEYVNLAGGTASTSGASSVTLGTGASIVLDGNTLSRSAITVIGTASDKLTCYEGK